MDQGETIIQTKDGGYAIAGTTVSFTLHDNDGYIIKLDSAGNVQWTRTIGGGYEAFVSIIQTKDGGYAITGNTLSFGAGNYDVYVVKIDSVGNLLWTKSIGGSNDDAGYCIIQTKDMGFAITGWTMSFGAGSYDVYVVKLDSLGLLQWGKTYGGSGADYGYSIIQTLDGGYAVAGSTQSFSTGLADFYFIKLDSAGNSCDTSGNGGIEGSGGIIVNKDSGRVGNGGSITSRNKGIVDSGGAFLTICKSITGFNNLSTVDNSISLYPNPANSKLFIDLQNIKGNSIITLYDISGNKLLTQTENETPLVALDVSAYSPGIYLLKIQTEDGATLVRKVAIAR